MYVRAHCLFLRGDEGEGGGGEGYWIRTPLPKVFFLIFVFEKKNDQYLPFSVGCPFIA